MSEIQDFYKGSTILITGGTGFLGKLLVEKLLRSCRTVKHIFLLMRSKNGLCAKKRMEMYFDDEVFSRLKTENSEYKRKITVIQGDIEYNNLNLNKEDASLLINTVNVIFHAAATINFNQKLRVAVETNVNGIRKIMELSRKMTQLKALVHVSTVYAYCYKPEIEEMVYECDVTYQEIVHLLRMHNDIELEQLTPKIIGKFPNTYLFTKALAEQFIIDNCFNLPVCIFRPAVVVSTAEEPIRGWIDNFYGPTGLIAQAACGILHVMHGGCNVFSNIVPADLVVNAIIATGWEVGQKRKILPIYNFVSIENPVTWGEYAELAKLGLNYPFSNSIWYMSLTFIRQKWLYDVSKFFLHLIPAFIADVFLQWTRNKPRFLNQYKKIHSFVQILSYFANNNWEYKNDNVVQLWKRMNKYDQMMFNFDVSTINWYEYFKHYIKGIRIYLFKDDLSNLEQARKKYRRKKDK